MRIQKSYSLLAKNHIFSNFSDQCLTRNDNANGASSQQPCKFPFKVFLDGQLFDEFHGCTKKLNFLGKSWCPTKLNGDGEFHLGEDEHFGYCSPNCPSENDCVWNPWSSWSDCSKTCGSGLTQRSRTVLKEAKLDGEPCSEEDNIQSQQCNKKPCPICKWGEWSDWSECKWGTRIRQRTGNEACTKDEGVETEECTLPQLHCQWSQWSGWSPCSISCGAGVEQRFRGVTQFAANGGFPCEQEAIETRQCSERPCLG